MRQVLFVKIEGVVRMKKFLSVFLLIFSISSIAFAGWYCAVCSGSGKCSTCNGSGWVTKENYFGDYEDMRCDDCGGTGECSSCGGTGGEDG